MILVIVILNDDVNMYIHTHTFQLIFQLNISMRATLTVRYLILCIDRPALVQYSHRQISQGEVCAHQHQRRVSCGMLSGASGSTGRVGKEKGTKTEIRSST